MLYTTYILFDKTKNSVIGILIKIIIINPSEFNGMKPQELEFLLT